MCMAYGTAFGGLFALAFAFAYQRIGRLSARGTAALLAAAGATVAGWVIFLPLDQRALSRRTIFAG
jgi:hypothetical protein